MVQGLTCENDAVTYENNGDSHVLLQGNHHERDLKQTRIRVDVIRIFQALEKANLALLLVGHDNLEGTVSGVRPFAFPRGNDGFTV